MTVADTAYWTAACRARESARPDALFHDRWAAEIVEGKDIQVPEDICWSVVVRTKLLDELILRVVKDYSIDIVLNLGAGFDTRPYRLPLPSSLRWIDVDQPEIMEVKDQALSWCRPACRWEYLTVNINDRMSRRRIFHAVHDASHGPVLVVAEGLIAYLTEDQNALLAEDLSQFARMKHWLVDLISPGHLRTTTRRLGLAEELLLFGPMKGVEFFTPYGWYGTEYWSLQHAAARLSRRLIAPNRSWQSGGLCRYTHTSGVALLLNSLHA